MPTDTIGTLNEIQRLTNGIEWKIPEFSSLPEGSHNSYRSPQFSFAGETWHLSILPNGSAETDSVGFVSVYLVKDSSRLLIRLHCCFSLKTSDEKSASERSSRITFKKMPSSMGYHRYISRSMLLTRFIELLPRDTLTVLCNLKISKSTENAGDVYSSALFDRNENKVLSDLNKIFHSKEDCDVVIKMKEQEFKAHKIILKARSPVLAATFIHEMKEKATNVLEIDDFDPTYFSEFLNFLYSGNIDIISEENIFSLFAAADKYDVQDLRAKCVVFMKMQLSVESFCDIKGLAECYSETDLLKLTNEFFIKNAPDIIVTDSWKSYLRENPDRCNELLIQLLAPNKSSSKAPIKSE